MHHCACQYEYEYKEKNLFVLDRFDTLVFDSVVKIISDAVDAFIWQQDANNFAAVNGLQSDDLRCMFDLIQLNVMMNRFPCRED